MPWEGCVTRHLKFPMAGMGWPLKLQLQKGLHPHSFRSKTALLRTQLSLCGPGTSLPTAFAPPPPLFMGHLRPYYVRRGGTRPWSATWTVHLALLAPLLGSAPNHILLGSLGLPRPLGGVGSGQVKARQVSVHWMIPVHSWALHRGQSSPFHVWLSDGASGYGEGWQGPGAAARAATVEDRRQRSDAQPRSQGSSALSSPAKLWQGGHKGSKLCLARLHPSVLGMASGSAGSTSFSNLPPPQDSHTPRVAPGAESVVTVMEDLCRAGPLCAGDYGGGNQV